MVEELPALGARRLCLRVDEHHLGAVDLRTKRLAGERERERRWHIRGRTSTTPDRATRSGRTLVVRSTGGADRAAIFMMVCLMWNGFGYVWDF